MYIISRKLTKLLRHNLDNIEHDNAGYVEFNIIKKILPNITIEIIKEIVKNDKKNRFDIKISENKFFIRANQGHSSGNIDENEIFEIITKPIYGVYHGTYSDKVDSIFKNGLSKMNRKHIHIAESDSSISGKRKSADTKIYIDMKTAINDGIVFFRSKNNVILTRGNDDGILLPKYLSLKYIKID